MDLDPEQSVLDLHCLSKRLQIYFSRRQKYTTFVVCALRVNECEFSVYTVTIVMKCMHFFAPQTTY